MPTNINDFKFNYDSSDPGLMKQLRLLQLDGHEETGYTCSFDEVECLKDYVFQNPKKYRKILDLGCGMGRSSVAFRNVFDLTGTFYLADFNKVQWTGVNEDCESCGMHHNADSIPYNSLDITREFCANNNLENVNIIDLSGNEIKKLRDIDLVYSFHSIGFHWSIEEAFRKYSLEKICSPDCVFVFGVREDEHEFEQVSRIGDFVAGDIIKSKKTKGTTFEDFIIYKKQ